MYLYVVVMNLHLASVWAWWVMREWQFALEEMSKSFIVNLPT